jgi:hypothetical protein
LHLAWVTGSTGRLTGVLITGGSETEVDAEHRKKLNQDP